MFAGMEHRHAGTSNSREKKKREQGSRFVNEVLYNPIILSLPIPSNRRFCESQEPVCFGPVGPRKFFVIIVRP